MRIAKPGEIKEMYEKNLALLSPWLKDSVSGISEKELWEKVEVVYNGEGCPVCRYRQGDRIFHITGSHPVREAEKWCGSIRLKDSAEVFLYGTGFGYALFELFARKMPHTLVFVLEQDLYLFKAMLYYFDLSPLIETEKIIFLVGDSSHFKKAFDELFYSLIFLGTTYPTVLFSLPALRNFKKEYLEIHRYVFKELSLLTSCLGNSHLDNMTGLRNLAANAGAVLKNPYPACLKEKYRGVPAFIVSNGPSLDRSMPLLKEIRGRGLMICVESAIVPLTKSGIVPDILAVVERTKNTYLYHFENRSYSPDISLIALALVDPRVFPSFPGAILPVFRKGEAMNRWFNRNLGGGREMDAGMNVSHFAAGVAMYLGADPIVFVGQDFAYGPEGATHSKDAVASQKQGKQAREMLHAIETVYVEGNNGEMIPSNRLWVNFRLGLEHIVGAHPEHRFYNATDGGAKIRGTERAQLGELIGRYCTEPIPYRVNDLIAKSKADVSIGERRVLLAKFIGEVKRYSGLFRSLADETNAKKLNCDKMMLLCCKEDREQDHALLDKTYRENVLSIYEYLKDALCRSFFQQPACSYFYLLNRLGLIDTQEKRAQAFDLLRQLYRDLRAVSQSLSVTFEETAENLENVLDEFPEKEA